MFYGLVSRIIFPYDETQMSTETSPENEFSLSEGSRNTTLKKGFFSGWLLVIWETIRYAIIAAIIIIPIRTFIAQPFVVSGNSMFPTFHNGEYLIVNEFASYVGDYKRGDVVILRYPVNPSKYFIKRVIGLPGETVTITNGTVSITSPTRTTPLVLIEPYVKNPKLDSSSRTLTQDEYFVMGDNRAQSSDSRVWGPVPKKLMDGKSLIRLFPFTQIALHPGEPESCGVSFK